MLGNDSSNKNLANKIKATGQKAGNVIDNAIDVYENLVHPDKAEAAASSSSIPSWVPYAVGGLLAAVLLKKVL